MKRRGRRASRRGAIIIGVLFFSLAIAILLMGIGIYATAHQTRAHLDSQYAKVMDVTEAGLNYELLKITLNPASADQSPGNTYTFGQGSFKVYCVNQDGSSPWNTGSSSLFIYSTGTVDGVSRTVRLGAQSTSGSTKVWSSPTAVSTNYNIVLLTAIQIPNPTQQRVWRIRNTKPFNITVRWTLVGTGYSASGIVAKANSDTFFIMDSTNINAVYLTNGSQMTTTVSVDGNQTYTAAGVTYNFTNGQTDGANTTKASINIPGGVAVTPPSSGFAYNNTWVEINPR